MTILFIIMAPFAALGAIAAWFYVSYAIGFSRDPNRQLYLFLKDTRWNGKYVYVPSGKEEEGEVIVYQELPLPAMPPIPEPDDTWSTLIPAAQEDTGTNEVPAVYAKGDLHAELAAEREAKEFLKSALAQSRETHEQTCAELHGLLKEARHAVSLLKNSLAESSKEVDAARGEVLVMTWQDLPRIQADLDAARADLQKLRAAINDPELSPQDSIGHLRERMKESGIYEILGDP